MIAAKFCQVAACLLAGASLLSAAPAPAEPELPPWKLPPHAWFLKRMPPPPSMNSKAGRADLAAVIKMQSTATPQQIARAKWTFNLSIFTFGEALGKGFVQAHFPKTAFFFKGLNDLVFEENNVLKNHFKRPHPFEVDPAQVHRWVVAPPGYSYPGFHTARCVVFVHVLTTLDPSGKNEFERIAKQVEVDRILAGEHFPSDIQGGKILGELIYSQLIKDKNFIAAVQALKVAEWSPPPPVIQNLHIPIP